jgi:mono/diheme cytochrome c family protein
MRKWIISIALIAVITSLIFFVEACRLHYPAEKVEFKASPVSDQLREGRHFAILICGPCHYDPATNQFTGKRLAEIPRFAGKIYSSNITNHPVKGIANYSDNELAYLIRTGVARNGEYMPYMQRPHLSDQHLKAIIAFLRSDDPLVKPSETAPPQTNYTIFGKMGIAKSKPIPYPDKEIPLPANDKISLGKYLVFNLSCVDCHSKTLIFVDVKEPEKSAGFLGGGNKLKNKKGKTIRASNLTPHETGLGNWTEAQFKRALKEGISKNDSEISFPMPRFTELSDEEASAIFAYLKTVPPIKNKIKKK